jgi:hypothetical protein
VIAEFALVPSGRTVRRWDVAAVVIVVGFTAVGLLVGVALWGLGQLTQGLLEVAAALDATGQAVGRVAGTPLIGEQAGQLADDISRAAGAVRVDAAQLGAGVRVVAVGVGTAITLVGVAPVGLLYVPLRWARRRELRALRRLLAAPVDPMLVEYLARSAVCQLPYAQLRRVSTQPWRDVDRGLHHPLAAAELRRLGLSADAGWSRPAPGAGAGAGQ